MSVVTATVKFDNGTGQDVDDTARLGSSRWWDKPIAEGEEADPQVHNDLVPYVQTLETAWSKHDTFDRLHDRIYENRALLGLKGAAAALKSVGFNPSRLMVGTSIVDTFTSRFEKRETLPNVVVDDADYELKRQAAEFNRFIRGKMREPGFKVARAGAIKDGGVRGTGIAYIDEGDEDIVVEKVHRWELFVDPHEASASDSGRNGAVRQMHRVRRVAREVLEARFPEHKDAIRNAPDSRTRQHEASTDEWAAPVSGWDSRGLVDLYESWHLPSAKYEEDVEDCCDDGRKAICIEGATLLFERWERPRFPFAILRRHYRQDGFWGQGSIERLAEALHDINRTARDIQRNVEVNGNFVIFTPQAMDNIPTEKLTGRGPMRVRYAGSGPPIYKAPDPVTPSHLGYLEKLIGWCHDFEGVSQWSAQGRSPLGAGASGIAIDTMEDLQSDRHASFEATLSRWTCEAGQLVIDACRATAERMKAQDEAEGRTGKKARKLKASWLEHGTMQRIEWNGDAMDDELYRLEIEPTAFLPATRAGRLASIKELSGLNVWTPEQLLELFTEPDLAGASRERLAKIKNARRVMAIIGNPKKEVPPPEPEWGLELHRDMALDFISLALVDGAPEEVVQRYRDYADMAQSVIDKGKTADPMAAGAPPMPGDPAMGPPGMPPMPMPPGGVA